MKRSPDERYRCTPSSDWERHLWSSKNFIVASECLCVPFIRRFFGKSFLFNFPYFCKKLETAVQHSWTCHNRTLSNQPLVFPGLEYEVSEWVTWRLTIHATPCHVTSVWIMLNEATSATKHSYHLSQRQDLCPSPQLSKVWNLSITGPLLPWGFNSFLQVFNKLTSVGHSEVFKE